MITLLNRPQSGSICLLFLTPLFWSSHFVLRHYQRQVMLRPTVQSASLSWNKAPTWGIRPDFYYRQTVAGLLMWGDLSDERAGLSFTIAADLRQRSHSRVRVPWDSRPYFSASDQRLPFSIGDKHSHVCIYMYIYSDVLPKKPACQRFNARQRLR
jgi:hypothetical protein